MSFTIKFRNFEPIVLDPLPEDDDLEESEMPVDVAPKPVGTLLPQEIPAKLRKEGGVLQQWKMK